jgi:hypothetical protein
MPALTELKLQIFALVLTLFDILLAIDLHKDFASEPSKGPFYRPIAFFELLEGRVSAITAFAVKTQVVIVLHRNYKRQLPNPHR